MEACLSVTLSSKHDDVCRAFTTYLKTGKPLRESTIKAYVKAVRTFDNWLRHNTISIADVNQETITRYHEEKGAVPAYRNFILGALRVWFDQLIEACHTTRNPARELARSTLAPSRQTVIKLEREEVKRLLEAAECLVKPEHRARDSAVVALLSTTGASTQELCGLTDQDLMWMDGRLVLRLNGIKGKPRYVVLKGEAQGALQAWLDTRIPVTTYVREIHAQRTFWEVASIMDPQVLPEKRPPQSVFWPSLMSGRRRGWPLSDQGLRAVLRRLAKLAGISHRVTPRAFRTLAASCR